MSDEPTKFAKLKQSLARLNIKRKKKYRISESKLITSSYLSHIVPSSVSKLILAPFTRLSLRQQIGLPTQNVLSGGFKAVNIHLSIGLIYPAAKLCFNKTDLYFIHPKFTPLNSIINNGVSTSFGFLLVYPLDVAYSYIISINQKMSLLKYVKTTVKNFGLKTLYKGGTLGLFTAFPYNAISTNLNNFLQMKVQSNVKIPTLNFDEKNIDSDTNDIAKKLKPVTFYPWNIISGSVSSLFALGLTYPLDTARRRYIINSEGCHTPIASLKNTFGAGLRVMYRGFFTRFFSMDPPSNFSSRSFFSTSTNPIKSVWTAFKSYAGLNTENPEKVSENLFEYSVNLLISQEDPFNYRKFQNYLKGICEYCGIIGKKAVAEDKLDDSLVFLLHQYRVVCAMTEFELESTSHKHFTGETKKLLAEAAKVDLETVENTLMHFDVSKTDRKWYLLRQALGRPLPKSFDEREYESYQRPIMQYIRMKNPPSLEAEMIIKRSKESKKYIDPNKPKHYTYYRKPTSGISRWRTRPFTKYFPYHLIKL